MMYKGSNWTRGELGHERPADPSVPCAVCESHYKVNNDWGPRYIDNDQHEPDGWVCDECIERARQEYDLAKKERNHKNLQEFAQ